ncbi:MAG: DUF2637 domain-containing protein [Streptomyces sp.]|nr:DUF2637 domain-containing protein [Streptomyces sp.]NUS11313.1 DUF2637 domain-containing protein [Streptomyces sp.]NUS23412.1 DUF2637 domain-containing protein [Streptomyces sp.]
MPTPNGGFQVTALQRKIIAGVTVGAAAIAGIGFLGSYTAVRRLAEAKGFGAFAVVFPIGVDAGILVLLALDLLLTWLRMPLGILRHTAWLLTTATIAFNGAAAWPDPVGTGMHAVIPVLFVVVIEAARHAVGKTADIIAGRRMESVRVSRWLLDPVATFLLWRRMKLWELRSYEQVIALERQRMVERARLRARYGRRWRREAPIEAVLALRLTRYGRPVGAPVESVLNLEPAPAGAPAPALSARGAAVLEAAPDAHPTAPAPAASSPGVPSGTEEEPAIVDPARTGAHPSHAGAVDDFDARAASAIAVTQSAGAHPDAHPSAETECAPADPDAEEDAHPTALVLDLDLARTLHPDVRAPEPAPAPAPGAHPVPQDSAPAQPSGPAPVPAGAQLQPGDLPFLPMARKLNIRSLNEGGGKASLRLLRAELGVGQARAQRLQAALPNTLAAALAAPQPDAKEA